MAALDLGTLMLHVGVDGTNAVLDALGEISEATRGTGNAGDDAGAALENFSARLSAIGAGLKASISTPLIELGKECVNYASDLTETLSKTEVVFGANADAVIEWSESSVYQMGIAQETALNMVSTFGDFSTAMGLSTQQAAEMSISLTQLAADMASFKNISVERANIALNSIYTGETESLKAMGIVMTQANLQAYANTQGIEKNIQAMTQQELVMLRYRYVMSQTKNAQGDFVRTGDSLANQTRKLSENVKELSTGFGKILEPTVTAATAKLNDLVSWVDGLSDSTKAAVVAVAAVAAGIPLVISAVGTVIGLITKLQGALAVVMANPVTAAIAGVVAALAIAAGAIAAINQRISEHNQVVSAMEDKHTTVSTSYETMISIAQKEGASVDDTISAIRDTIQNASDLIVYIEANESEIGSETSTAAVLDSIDKAIKAREMYCEIAGKKPEDDPVWQELNELRAGIADGSISITGEDKDGTLARLQELLHQTEDDLSALSAYQKTVIEPKIQFSEQPEEAAKSLLETCKEIAGYDGDDVNFVFGYTGLNELEQALGNAIASTANWKGDMEEIGSSLTAILDQQKEVLLSMAAAQAMAALQANAAGALTDSQLETTLRAINSQYIELSGNLDTSSEAFENLVKILNNGDPSDDVEAWKAFAAAMKDAGAAMADTQTPAEQVATASGEIAQAMASGADDTDAMAGSVANMSSGLGDLADDMSNKVSDAYDTYQSDIDAANQAEADGIDAVNDSITAKQGEVDMLSLWAATYSECGGDVSAALEVYKQAYGDEAAAFIENKMAQLEAEGNYNANVYTLVETARNELTELESNKAADVQKVRDDAAAARQTAEETLGTNLAAITSGFNQQEILAMQAQCETLGNEEGASQASRIFSLEAYCRGAEETTESGNFNLLSLNRQYIGDVEGLTETGYDAGNGVGANIGEGMYDGLESWGRRIRDLAAQTVNAITSAMRQAGDIHSPSRKMRDDVGKPLMEGIAVGVRQTTPSVIDTMRESMQGIMSAAMPSGWTLGTQGAGGTTSSRSTIINQTNNFATRTLTPYEQQLEIKRLNRGLAEVYG